MTGEWQEALPTGGRGDADHSGRPRREAGGDQELQELHTAGHPHTAGLLRLWAGR